MGARDRLKGVDAGPKEKGVDASPKEKKNRFPSRCKTKPVTFSNTYTPCINDMPHMER